MVQSIISPKKLIEVALPLDAINSAAAREKTIRHGHPSTLHLWWARRPLAAARAVIFSQLVHDPEDLWRCQNPGKEPNAQVKGHWTKARGRLFSLIEDLVKWENTTNKQVLERAQEEIRRSWQETCALNKEHPQADVLFNPDRMPGLHDPFAGGGAIPLEAQRLGLEPYASDLNPVAVLINKAMIEIPPKFANRPPVRSDSKVSKSGKLELDEIWSGVSGLAEDVRFYGKWMREEAEKRIGYLYPKVSITEKIVADRPDLKHLLGENLTVIAWIWARTVRSSNPAFSHLHVPLVKSFNLTSKKGKTVWIEPVVHQHGYNFVVRTSTPPNDSLTGTIGRKGGVCVMSRSPIDFKHIRSEAKLGRLGQKLMAIVAEGSRGRVFLSPDSSHEDLANSISQERFTDLEITHWPGCTNVVVYGLDRFLDLFSPRQQKALITYSDLVIEATEKIRQDAVRSGIDDDGTPLQRGGTQALAYAEAVATYLALAVSKTANRSCSVAPWMPSVECPGHLFSRHAIPMNWDYAEANIVNGPSGSFSSMLENTVIGLEQCGAIAGQDGHVFQADARTIEYNGRLISTDPPYYDNIPYSELSDFFYIWLRRSLQSIYPQLLSTIAVPKSEELVANAQRFGGKTTAEQFFLSGMTDALRQMATSGHCAYPVTIYYAFKQAETAHELTSSTGWVAFLAAIIEAGFEICGTWPMRTEREARTRGIGSNALASSVILVCRHRTSDATSISRRNFIRELNSTLPIALDAMTRESEGLHSPVAPVDLSQAIIGPGMAVFSKYASVLEADGSPMTVRTALQLINRFLAEDDFDADTQFCLHWFEQYGWETGKFGEADTLARAKGTSVEGVKQAGVLHSAGGNVRLLRWAEYPCDWDPKSDQRLPIWEVLHQLIHVFNREGEIGAAAVFAAVQSKAEAARQLAYRLYTLCERKNWAEDARAYNEVVTSWSGIEAAAAKEPSLIQRELFDN
jgi:putative DNA methylase